MSSLFKYWNDTKNYLFNQMKEIEKNQLEWSFILFLLLISHKLLALFIKDSLSLMLLTVSLFLLFQNMGKICIPLFLENQVIQFFLFLGFFLENLIFTSLFFCIFIVFTVSYFIFCSPYIDILFPTLLLLLFIYSSFRKLIFHPEIQKLENISEKLKDPESFSWEKISEILSLSFFKIYNIPFRNNLPKRLSAVTFPEVSKRYIGGTILHHFHMHRQLLTYIGAAVASASSLFFAYGYRENDRIRAIAERECVDKEISIKERETSIKERETSINEEQGVVENFVKLKELDYNTRSTLIKQNLDLLEYFRKNKDHENVKKILADIEKLRDPATPVLVYPEALKLPANLKKTAFEGGFSQDIFTFFV